MKKILKAVMVGMAVIMLAGCGKEVEQTEQAEQQEIQEKPEEAEEEAEETELKEEAGEVSDPESDETEKQADTSEEAEENIIELPQTEGQAIDYTSIEGLQLEPGSRIAFVVKNTETEYWTAVKKGIQQAVNDLNENLGYQGDDKIQFTFEGPKNETDVNNQVNILDAVISENPSAICLAAVDMDSCMAQLEAATENEIPVIILDSGVNSIDMVNSSVATDNEAAGREAASRLCSSIGDEGDVAVISHGQLGESSRQRVEGFQKEINENHPNVSVVQTLYEPMSDKDVSIKEQAEAVMALYPDIKGFFCTNEVMGSILLSVMSEYENKEVAIVGFDMGKTQAEAVRNGKMEGVICQNPYGMGYATVVAGARAALGMENDGYVDAGFQWIDKDTIDLEENKKYVY